MQRTLDAIHTASGTIGWHRHDGRRTGATILRQLDVSASRVDVPLSRLNPTKGEEVSDSGHVYIVGGVILRNSPDPDRDALIMLADADAEIEHGTKQNQAARDEAAASVADALIQVSIPVQEPCAAVVTAAPCDEAEPVTVEAETDMANVGSVSEQSSELTASACATLPCEAVEVRAFKEKSPLKLSADRSTTTFHDQLACEVEPAAPAHQATRKPSPSAPQSALNRAGFAGG